MKTVPAKSILQPMKNGNMWFGSDYNMNIYRGCSHGCIYCDSRSECYGVDNFDEVRVKENAVELFTGELARKKKKGVIGIGAMSDSYNPYERKYGYTRKCLEQMAQRKFGVCLATKSDLIVRDLDVLSEINQHHNAIVKFSITSIDDKVSKSIEQFVAPTSKRFDAMSKVADNGIFTGVLLMPVLPFITDNDVNIVKIVRAASSNGARFIYAGMGMTLRDRQREHYYEKLRSLGKPELVQKYIKRFGDKYSCLSPKAERLYYQFQDECVRAGLLYKMPDIIKAYKKDIPDPSDQLTLF